MNIRYTLRSRRALRWVMDHPGRGVPYSVRSLAEAVGRSTAFIGHLLTGETDDCEVADAHAISEAVGVAVLVLFAPPASPEQNESSMQQ